jgi:hypothetical protein
VNGHEPGGPGRTATTGADGEWMTDAVRLLQAVREAAREVSGGARGASLEGLLREAGHASECRSCPLCQGIAVLRQIGPDLLDHVSAVTAGLARSLRAAAEQQSAAPPAAGGAAVPGVPRTEWIDITDDDPRF